MSLETPSKYKRDLKEYLKDREIVDIVLFGSAIKGKALPNDIDIALITNKERIKEKQGFHISIIKPEEFFKNPPTIASTILREGYSLKHNRFLAEGLRFQNRVLFSYELKDMTPSLKVKIVNVLRGINKNKGIVEENKGEWLANQVFVVPIENSDIIEKFFLNFKVKFRRSYILMH